MEQRHERVSEREREVLIVNESDIVAARQTARSLAQKLGFGAIDASRIATAVSELTRNVVRYATDGQGKVSIRQLTSETGATGVEIQVRDEGPGIDDVELVMRDGYSSSKSLGLGLPGTRRLMDEMHIDSAPGRGTTVTIRKWKR